MSRENNCSCNFSLFAKSVSNHAGQLTLNSADLIAAEIYVILYEK